ncbi:hypothetical protein KAR91_33530 [Candidatus Pacearchaeota archaeon]|nr:hypothetical protein [Candidatus Pacearchaeota archaeon]
MILINKPKKPRPHDCCNVPANMDIQHPREDLTIEVCKICHCRHFRLKVDPLKLNLSMT